MCTAFLPNRHDSEPHAPEVTRRVSDHDTSHRLLFDNTMSGRHEAFDDHDIARVVWCRLQRSRELFSVHRCPPSIQLGKRDMDYV